MKKNIKLLLLAALAWPGIAMAQGQVTDCEHHAESLPLPASKDQKSHVGFKAMGPAQNGQTILRGPAKAVALPDNVTIEDWDFVTTWIDNNGDEQSFTSSVLNIAYGENNKVYIQGLSYYIPDAWVEGTINNARTQITIPNQLYGYYENGGNEYPMYLVGRRNYSNANVILMRNNDGTISLSQGYYIYEEASSTHSSSNYYGYHTGLYTYVVPANPAEERNLAIRNRAFFHGITYDWIDSNGKQHTSYLDSIATDPDQIIALMSKVYTDQSVPGNRKRGFSRTGGNEDYNDVYYTGVGTIKRSGNANKSTSYSYYDTYGWNIANKKPLVFGSKTTSSYWGTYNHYYAQMDTTDYLPQEDGVTLLLVEVTDDFEKHKDDGIVYNNNGWQYKNVYDDPYKNLRYYIEISVKSVRVITESKRVGTGFERSTLFKIDADKLNKFYLLAKGQLRWIHNLYYNSYLNGSTPGAPSYCYTTYNGGIDGFSDALAMPPFFHMFEQFSPVSQGASSNETDFYWDLVDMKSFGVEHDCMTVPFRYHQFQMYGEDSDAADCQDVRDMMFTVPDYRMLKDNYRDNGFLQNYVNYNTRHQPKLGLFVIHQDEIPAGIKISSNESTTTDPAQLKGLYKHQLKWYSNLDDFLPSDDQYYELWELVVDEFGKESYVPVYYRNANGKYRVEQNDQVTWVSDTAGLSQYLVPIVLSRNSAATVTETVNGKQVKKLLYTDVYVDMTAGSQTKTYVVRGRDSENFLSLQMSNQQEIVIPGLDPHEKVRLIGATYYSRYNPDNELNCYSNKLEMRNNAAGLTANDVDGKVIKFYRSSRAAQVDAEGNAVTDPQGNIQYVGDAEVEKFLVATGTLGGGTLTITLNGQADQTLFPVGKTDEKNGNVQFYAGYHANGSLSFPFIEKTDGTLDFGNLVFWDNFTVDVSKNKHPLQYLYRMEVADANENVDSYSNNVRVPVYKTASRINPPLTKDEVDGDAGHNPDYSPGDVEFGAQVQLSSKTEILRYDAYRWDENTTKRFIVDKVYNNDTEQDLPPTGMAGNQGEWYTVTMNDEDDSRYYYSAPAADQPAVTTDQPQNWATFIDYYPKKLADATNEGMAYVYAPVVELFSKGYNATNASLKRTDYNTYGGPMQKSAVGKVDAEVVTETDENGNECIHTSEVSWVQNGKEYCFYNLPVRLKVFDIPAGYEVYKVRAWRLIDSELLGERPASSGYPDRTYRLSDDYLFEELTYGDEKNGEFDADGMRAAKLSGYELGSRETGYYEECRATFGAVKLQETETMPYQIIVRVYFTKANADAAVQPAGGPRRALTLENLSADGKYYVAEKVISDEIKGTNIITGINGVKADLNHEVESVNYVNTMGQVSNRPWQGVNVVVTRYTDGTTKTTKAVF